MKTDVSAVKKALVDAGVEIYRTRNEEIQVAERVRLHIMDSGIRISFVDGARVVFVARSQRSDFPNEAPDDLFARVRTKIGDEAGQRGYTESRAATTEVKDPVDPQKILDVWHEVTYAKPVDDVEALVDEVRWALSIEKYVGR